MGHQHEPTAAEAEQAARKVASADRRLPYEEAAERSDRLDDAIHWSQVYEELFSFKQNLLATLVEQRDSVDRDGLDEVENDEIVLTREADRLSRRLEFWRDQVRKRQPS